MGGCLSVHLELTVKIFMEKNAGSQVYGHNELILYFHGLSLAAIHIQGEWKHYFKHVLGVREGG